MPPMPMAASRLIAPVGIASIRTRVELAPIFMMEPFPQLFSICAMARFSAFFLSSCTVETAIHPPVVSREPTWPCGRNLPGSPADSSARRKYETRGRKSSAPREGEGILDVPNADRRAFHEDPDHIESVGLIGPAVPLNPYMS